MEGSVDTEMLFNTEIFKDLENEVKKEIIDEDEFGYSPPVSPFFGFSNADIPQPILIKTEPVDISEDVDEDDDCVIINVTKASIPLPPQAVKKEKEDEEDVDIFYGFNFSDIPKPIVIKDEPLDDDVTAERAEDSVIPDFFLNSPDVPLGPTSNVPGDDLIDEFDADVRKKNDTPNFVVLNKTEQIDEHYGRNDDLISSFEFVKKGTEMKVLSPEKVESPPIMETVISHELLNNKSKIVQQLDFPRPSNNQALKREPTLNVESSSANRLSQHKQREMEEAPLRSSFNETKNNYSNAVASYETIDQIQLLDEEYLHMKTSFSNNIQIIEENGEKIVIMDQEAMKSLNDDTDEDSDAEDREFTVIVEEEEEEEEVDNDIHIDENNVIEANSIEDILAQFESESAPRSVSCPNCRKCFVSSHFLNLHISNSSTMCDLCNTQCCSQVNLRNHKNLECDLSKRKRNIDLIAQETAILGRKPIEPEKYYNLPMDDDEDDEDMDMDLDDDLDSDDRKSYHHTANKKPTKSINDCKYECHLCGRYVKILDSHMKFVHGLEGSAARGAKFRCPECSVLVSDLPSHLESRHGEHAGKVVVSGEDECILAEIVRCRHPGCDLFFNNNEEASEHVKREHTDEVRLACGMGGCDEVFDNRGALKRHRTEAHPELEEFKPVDLEPDDPDRAQDLTVACPVCERKFKHKNTCTVHIKTNHLGWTKRKLFECPECFRAFDNKKAVESHREAVHLGIRTVCPLCEKPVTRLDLHVRMVHTDLPEWPCPDCGKKFKRKFDLNRHRVTVHLGVRNFPCDLCGKRFADMKDMTRHKNAVHYGMKIKWNSRKNKVKAKLKKAAEAMRDVKRESREHSHSSGRDSDRVKSEDRGGVSIPVEYIETVETTGEETIDISGVHGGLEGSTVILDPVLQSQLAAVQGGPGEPRVLIEADPENSGGLRFVVIQDDENGSVVSSAGETVEMEMINNYTPVINM